MSNQSDKRTSLEQSLLAYRCINVDKSLTWKQNYVNEKFSSDSLLQCTKEERLKFRERLNFNIMIQPSIKMLEGQVKTGRDLLNTIVNPENKNKRKEYRSVVFSTDQPVRPQGQNAFLVWNGLQIIDMDIKDRAKAAQIKQYIFEDLKKYNWFLGVAFSSSGKGLHIYTKIQIPVTDEKDLKKKKILFFTNFRHKYSFVYISCKKILDKIGSTEDDLLKWMDLAMFRPQQGAFIPYDEDVLINTNFFEDFIYVCFDNVEDMGDPDVDWVSYPPLKQVFKRWEWFETKGPEDEDSSASVNIKSAPELDISGGIVKYHYKHTERWKLANTLVQIYGLDKGIEYMRLICTNDTTDKEIEGDCRTAERHNKAIDPWAVNRLNKYHHFKIKTNIQAGDEDKDINQLLATIDHIDNPLMLTSSVNKIEFYITKNQYLGDIKKELLQNCGHITLIEAGAGVGKTEMVKSLARDGKRIMMVMPFQSTIKSKVEGDDLWLYAYGNKKVDLNKSQCIALTIDKFSHINLVELKAANFDYIFIDESHLLFQSEYRPVMPKVIDMIKNSEVPIIMMSGTPVGETAFFPELTHLKVTKEDVREKKFKVILTEDDDSMFLDMCHSMAEDISKGRRILFPTNKGSLYKEQVQAAVQYFCEEEFHCRYADSGNPVIVNYYKKSNLGDDFMENINKNKSIGKTDVLLCSNYLSVGVDINDKYEFSIYINDLWMPQEIEQFANRLRANNLYINLYVSRNDGEGNPKPLFTYKDINLKLNEEEMKGCHAILRLCNSMIERSPLEYKYNSLISSIIYNNKFVEYNDIENKYYLNETAYKTIMFERKYREFVEQLPVIVKGMQNYGYEYSAVNKYKFKLADGVSVESICDKKKQAREALRLKNTEDVYDLINLITDDRLDIYRDALRGQFEIKKGNEWKEDVVARTMTVRNIEVFEKVVPIFMSLSKMFELDDIRAIFEYCKRGEHYNFSAIKRIRVLANILYNDKRNRLDIPIKKFMQEVDYFIEERPHGAKKSDIDKFIQDFSLDYAKSESSKEIPVWLSVIAMQEIQKSLGEIFKCLVDVGRPKKNGLMSLKKCEILWQEKSDDIYKLTELDTKSFILGDMMDFDVESIDMTQEPEAESVLVPVEEEKQIEF